MKLFAPFNHFIFTVICLCLVTVSTYGQTVLDRNRQKDFLTNNIQTNIVFSGSSEPEGTNIIVTLDGNTYNHTKVVLIGRDGLSIRHLSVDGISAIAFIQLTNLPLDYQKKWGPFIKDQANEFNHEMELKDRIKLAATANAPQDEQQTTESTVKTSDNNLGGVLKHWVNISIDHGAFIHLEDDSVWEIDRVDVDHARFWNKSESIVCSKTTAIAVGYDYTLTNIDRHENAHAKFVGYAKRWIKENQGHGQSIVLEDRARYKVDIYDKSTALMWGSKAKMALGKNDSLNTSDFILINVDTGETVRAKFDGWEF